MVKRGKHGVCLSCGIDGVVYLGMTVLCGVGVGTEEPVSEADAMDTGPGDGKASGSVLDGGVETGHSSANDKGDGEYRSNAYRI